MSHKFKSSIVIVSFIILSAVIVNGKTEGEFQPVYHPQIEITPKTGHITIDGMLNDDAWKQAAKATNFTEVNPGDQVKPPVESEAWMTYDETHLYVALIAYDDPSKVRVSLRDRDNIFQDDYFGVMLDTYGDYAWGYEIFVNPLGIQGDLRVMSSGDEDITLDLVFDSKGIVTDEGYQVEIAIPFSSLRFPDKKEHMWRVNFWRDHQRDVRRRYAWAAQDRDDPCWMCQWGTVTGIRNIKQSSNIDILPNMISYLSGSRENPTDKFDNNDPEVEASFNLRYGLSSNSSIELSLNPDFSQVESDAAQVDVNTTFGLYFNERRPFFQEGSNIFNSFSNAVYTRSINDPIIAGKFTGQFNRTSVAYLLAHDENSPLVIPLEEQSIQKLIGKSTSNIFRLRQTVLRDSYLGVLLTDRRQNDFGGDTAYQGGSGTVYGIDGILGLTQKIKFAWQVIGSHTEEPKAPDFIDTTADGYNQVYFNEDKNTVALDGETFNGHAYYTSLRYNSRKYSVSFDYTEKSPTFRTDNGFVTDNGRKELFAFNDLTFRPNKSFLILWGPGAHVGHVRRTDGSFRDEWINGWLFFRFNWQTDVKLEYLYSEEDFHNVFFAGISEVAFHMENRMLDKLNGGFSIRYGNRIYRGTPELAKNRDYSVYCNIKPSQRFFIQPNFRYVRMDDRDDGSNIFKGYIARSRFTYQFNREWFLRLIVQYNDFSKRMDFEPLLTYKINPFTVFYVGATTRMTEYNPAYYDDIDTFVTKMSAYQIFTKFQYLFRI